MRVHTYLLNLSYTLPTNTLCTLSSVLYICMYTHYFLYTYTTYLYTIQVYCKDPHSAVKQTAEALTRMISNEILDEEAAEQMYNAQVAFLSQRSDIPFTSSSTGATNLTTPNKLQHTSLSSPNSNTFISPLSYTGAGGATATAAATTARATTTTTTGGGGNPLPADRSSLDPPVIPPVRNNALFPKSSSDSMLVGRYSNNAIVGGGIPYNSNNNYNSTNTYNNNINMTEASQGSRSPFGNFNNTTTTNNNNTTAAPYTNDQPAINQQYSTTFTPSHQPPHQHPPHPSSHNLTSPIQTTVTNPSGNLISSEVLLTSYFYEWNKKLFLTPDVGYDSYEDPLSVEGQARIYR